MVIFKLHPAHATTRNYYAWTPTVIEYKHVKNETHLRQEYVVPVTSRAAVLKRHST